MLRALAARLPYTLQQELRRLNCWTQIRRARFVSHEPEFALMPQLVRPGDWVVDIGANVGYYTMLFAELTGGTGRVFAFEPMPQTFEILAANVRHARHRNVTMLNLAASNKSQMIPFSLPSSKSGTPDYFRARATRGGAHSVYGCALDSFDFDHPIRLVKVDTEGHEASVLDGMEKLIARDRPILLLEGDEALQQRMKAYGYRMTPRRPGSANLLFLPEGVDVRERA